jgi:hypothetical protein
MELKLDLETEKLVKKELDTGRFPDAAKSSSNGCAAAARI